LRMIKDVQFFRKWEQDLISSTPIDYEQNLRIFEAMIEEARLLRVWPPSNPMEGIEIDIKIAKAVNAV
jgi:hypothetical protein